jgi:hypothetical protein
MARTLVPVTDATPTKASLTTALAGTNNDLVFTAKSGGQWGNSIQVEYIDPGGTSATLAVTVRGFVVSVSLGRTASAIDTTATALKTAVDASLDASKLVSVANAAANDGTGLVIALTATALASGTWSVAQPALTNGDATNDHYFTGNDGQVVLEVVSTDAGSQTVTIKRSPTLRAGSPPSDEVVTVGISAILVLGPFATSEFNQNSSGDVYFDPSVSNTLDFRAYRVARA